MSKTFIKGIGIKCLKNPTQPRISSSMYHPIRCTITKTALSQPILKHNVLPRIYTHTPTILQKRFITDIPDPSEVNDVLQDKDIQGAYKKRIAWEKFIPRPVSYQEAKASNPDFSLLRLINRGMDVVFDYVSEFPPVQWVAEGFQVMHYEVGASWLGMIVICGISARALVQPLLWIAHRNRRGVFSIPEYRRLVQLYQLEASPTQRREMKIRMKKLAELSGYKKWKDWLPLMQFPIGILFILGLRLGLLSDPSTFDAGIYFFQNLGAPDPYYRLPVFYAASLFAYNLTVRAYWSWPSAILLSSVSALAFVFLSGMPQGVFIYLMLNLASRTTWMAIRRFNMMRLRLREDRLQQKSQLRKPIKTIRSGGVSPLTSVRDNATNKK